MRSRDFRSDTVTQPTEAMRLAMMQAVVGDDILGEDPSVQQLEEYSARLLGKEAAMFVISGSMANQVTVMTLTERGDEVLLGQESHIYNLESGGLAALSQVQVRTLTGYSGKFALEEVRAAIRPRGVQSPITRLLCLENTYDLNRGIALGPEYIAEVSRLARNHGLKVYMDGARLFNAAAELGVEASELVSEVDAVMFCLCKGLAAPVGAMLVGTHEFIEKARWIRQRLGGGMRQAGHMAAAGLVAICDMRQRLVEDHARAKVLAAGLTKIHSGLVEFPQTNIVRVDFGVLGHSAEYITGRLAQCGIKVKPIGETVCRMITHLDITDEDVLFALESIAEILA